ncbi:MAG TPA: IS91 family transposase [Mobilitalea sp.]|nr:IS91 family transposase [Mobilitalea sp.]
MPEIQDILIQYADDYCRNHSISYTQQKVINALMKCRTSSLGGHVTVCDECGHEQISYNSCKNRHCPKCQTLTKEKWIDNQKFNLLNVGYFHVVMTVPHSLHPVMLQNQEVCYNILFKAAAETLAELSGDKKYLGAQTGFTGILHTWGQNLMFHPHIHCIVPGGGLNKLLQWIPSKKKFFLPVKVVSRKFRGKFLALLKKAFYDGELAFHNQIKYLEFLQEFENFLTPIYKQEWVVYCKPPFKTAATVVEYLGRYTHRVAISNNRILDCKDGNVTFKWRDYKDNNKWKVMTITAQEFIRRFLLHVLPGGFMKIRHYGILGNRNKTKKLKLCKMLTNTPIIKKAVLSTTELIEKLIGKKAFLCPCCNSNRLSRYAYYPT